MYELPEVLSMARWLSNITMLFVPHWRRLRITCSSTTTWTAPRRVNNLPWLEPLNGLRGRIIVRVNEWVNTNWRLTRSIHGQHSPSIGETRLELRPRRRPKGRKEETTLTKRCFYFDFEAGSRSRSRSRMWESETFSDNEVVKCADKPLQSVYAIITNNSNY